MNTACNHTNVPKEMTEEERERAIHANQVYCKACEENGIKICAWENFSAWREYVDGRIDESQLSMQVGDELKKFSETFSKYTIVAEESQSVSDEETTRRERARAANKIYKQACRESGMSLCFFPNFASWSDYVHGRINDEEFADRAALDARKMAEEAQSP